MPQYKVPQNLDLPDKILGPLTLVQLGYLLIGGMVAYSIYRVGNIVLTVLVAAPIALLTIALAFVKVQNQPFGKFIFNLIIFALNPKTRVWHKGKISPNVKIEAKETEKQKSVVGKKRLDPSEVKRISRIQDQ